GAGGGGRPPRRAGGCGPVALRSRGEKEVADTQRHRGHVIVRAAAGSQAAIAERHPGGRRRHRPCDRAVGRAGPECRLLVGTVRIGPAAADDRRLDLPVSQVLTRKSVSERTSPTRYRDPQTRTFPDAPASPLASSTDVLAGTATS